MELPTILQKRLQRPEAANRSSSTSEVALQQLARGRVCRRGSTWRGSPCSTTSPFGQRQTTREAKSRTKSSSCVVTSSARPAAASARSAVAEVAAARRVERRGRLVHQQQRRIDRQRAGDGDALRFAARQLARQRAGAVARRQRRSSSSRAAAPRPRRAMRCTCTGASITFSQRRQVLEQAVELEHHADLARSSAWPRTTASTGPTRR